MRTTGGKFSEFVRNWFMQSDISIRNMLPYFLQTDKKGEMRFFSNCSFTSFDNQCDKIN